MKVRTALRIVLAAALALLLAARGYFAYVCLAYYRLPDNQPLTVSVLYKGGITTADGDYPAAAPAVGKPYRIVSYNVGFGAYSDDYGFFMDGGTESRARSAGAVQENIRGAMGALTDMAGDFMLLQEVDTDGTRSWHIDEREYIRDALTSRCAETPLHLCFAQNYDSPYLMYPLTRPHGANRSGILTCSAFPITSALRRSLPVETGFTKFLDLDRCYSVSRVPVRGGGELALYNLHLSAYTSDGTIADEQLRLLLADMQGEYEAGNWCVAGGDFNKDLLGGSAAYFGAADRALTWAQPIAPEVFDGVDIRLVAPLDAEHPVPSCRNADGSYHDGQYVVTVDGFLVSPNVDVGAARVIDTGFRWSDHNPVYLDFTLLDQ